MLIALRRAFRTLGRTPGFALVAIITLGLAMAAIGTTFSVVNSVLLKPLPYPGADRILSKLPDDRFYLRQFRHLRTASIRRAPLRRIRAIALRRLG